MKGLLSRGAWSPSPWILVLSLLFSACCCPSRPQHSPRLLGELESAASNGTTVPFPTRGSTRDHLDELLALAMDRSVLMYIRVSALDTVLAGAGLLARDQAASLSRCEKALSAMEHEGPRIAHRLRAIVLYLQGRSDPLVDQALVNQALGADLHIEWIVPEHMAFTAKTLTKLGWPPGEVIDVVRANAATDLEWMVKDFWLR